MLNIVIIKAVNVDENELHADAALNHLRFQLRVD